MPRQVRIEFDGAYYHLMCRGDRREAIYQDDQDRERFLSTLGETVGRTGWRVHAYVLMSNHYHLLVETPMPNLVRGMTWFQTTYTVRYNARHRLSGHLFAGRYKALLVDAGSENYLVTLLNYIHLNPVRAGLVKAECGDSLVNYRWSSLPGYYWPGRRPDWLVVEHGLGALQWKDTASDRRAFLDYVENLAREERANGAGQEALATRRSELRASMERGWYFGTETFREWLLEKARVALGQRSERKQNYHGAEIHDHGESEARRIIAQRLVQAGLQSLDLGRLAKGDPRKVQIAKEVRTKTSVPLSFVARELSMGTPMYVSKLTNRADQGQEYSPDP